MVAAGGLPNLVAEQSQKAGLVQGRPCDAANWRPPIPPKPGSTKRWGELRKMQEERARTQNHRVPELPPLA